MTPERIDEIEQYFSQIPWRASDALPEARELCCLARLGLVAEKYMIQAVQNVTTACPEKDGVDPGFWPVVQQCRDALAAYRKAKGTT